MENEAMEYEYFSGKLPNKTYVSKRIESKVPSVEDGIPIEK